MVDICVGYADKAILDPMVTVNKVNVQAYTAVALRREFAKLRKSSVSCDICCCVSYSYCATVLKGLRNHISCVNKSVCHLLDTFDCIF